MKSHTTPIINILAFLWLGFSPVFAQAEKADKADKPFTVVIDAGHGGKDVGAVGKIAYEKNLNLDVALLTGQLIQENFPEVNLVYTRTTDVFLPLQNRADIVNQNKADLFICIHTNSAETKAAKGVETFILGTDKMEQNLDVAMRENAVIKLESDYQTAYQGFDPNSIDSYIMFELMQNAYMDQSLNFATLVQRQFVENLHREERGVRQAAFWVLLKSACPSILLEMGFISNPEEEKYLASQKGKKEIAQSLYNAFETFYRKQKALSVQGSDNSDNSANPDTPVSTEETSGNSDTSENVLRYAIQICASKEKLANDDPKLKGIAARYFFQNNYYKYYCCPSANRDSVALHLPEVKKEIPDAWIIRLP
ncbi:MAG: N-acetylmuramoyl-L-alanine amidase [Paludibacteraceae bacterium]